MNSCAHTLAIGVVFVLCQTGHSQDLKARLSYTVERHRWTGYRADLEGKRLSETTSQESEEPRLRVIANFGAKGELVVKWTGKAVENVLVVDFEHYCDFDDAIQRTLKSIMSNEESSDKKVALLDELCVKAIKLTELLTDQRNRKCMWQPLDDLGGRKLFSSQLVSFLLEVHHAANSISRSLTEVKPSRSVQGDIQTLVKRTASIEKLMREFCKKGSLWAVEIEIVKTERGEPAPECVLLQKDGTILDKLRIRRP